jgi:predicted DNA-binding transcriptional regulator AlpA
MEIINVKEVSKYLKRSESSVRNMCSRRQIPHRVCGGRRLIFIKDEIDNWILGSPGTKPENLSGEKDI